MRLPFGFSGLASVLTKLYSAWVAHTYPFAGVGHSLSVHFTCDLTRGTAHNIRIGNRVTIDKHAWIYVSEATTGGDSPLLIIEDNCLIARHAQIGVKNRIHFERDVLLSASVLIADHIHSYEDTTRPVKDQGLTEGGRIRLEQGCWIGRGAAIVCDRGELILGRNCVVAANSVVTRSVPAYSVVAGNPARVVRQFDPVKGSWVLGSIGLKESGVGGRRPPGT